MAGKVMSTLRLMDANGHLPPKPEGHEDILNDVEIAIDPHQSLIVMKCIMDCLYRVLDEVGLGALHNTTDIPFLTSDNPVIWFDPSVPEMEMRPYVWLPGKPLTFIFPVAPNCIIYGHSSMREQFVSHGFGCGNLPDRKLAEAINRQICRFAYEAVFAQESGQERIIRACADVSPVLQTSHLPCARGEAHFFSYSFGPRKRKPRWED
jgi:hypothetical protein